MVKKILKPLITVTIFSLLLMGCATAQNLIGPEKYAKELIPSDRTFFRQVRAVEDKGELKVSGRLRQQGMMRLDIPDYVNVALVDQSGAVIAAQKVAYYPRVLTGRKHSREARFSARFAEMPPAGTTVRVSNVN